MASLKVKRRSRNRIIQGVNKLIEENVKPLYQRFTESDITLLNSYKEALENKLEKVLFINNEIAELIEEDIEYDEEVGIAMSSEVNLRNEIGKIKEF